MKTRNQELRDRHRRIVAWSVGIAALLHAAVFFFGPTFLATPMWMSEDDDVGNANLVMVTPTWLELRFGPPTLRSADGPDWTEPPERVLMAARLVQLPDDCAHLGRELDGPVQGRARLWVGESGRAEALGIVESTGFECADEAMMMVTDALWYRWLPTERFPAPIDLIQPVTLEVTRP